MGGRLPVYLSGENYDNGEGGREQKEWWTFANSKNLTIAEGVRDSIIDLLNNDLKIILVYPITKYDRYLVINLLVPQLFQY